VFKLSPVTERVKRLRERYRSTPLSLDAARTKIITECYKKNISEPAIIRNAHFIYDMCSQMPVNVWDDDLLVGNIGVNYRAANISVEYGSLGWLCNELRSGVFYERNTMAEEGMSITPEDAEYFLSVEEFWQKNDLPSRVDRALPPEVPELAVSGCLNFRVKGNGSSPVGHFNTDYGKAINVGFGGIKREAEEKLKEMFGHIYGNDAKKYTFYRAMVIICDAAIILSKRYAAVCREKAETAEAERKAELLSMADSLDWIMENPCRTFYEAVQVTLLYQQMMVWSGLLHGLTLGRFDQYTLKQYEDDIAAGRMTPDQAQEIVDCFFLKIADMIPARGKEGALNLGGYSSGQHMSIGGQKKDGSDATTPISYIMLQASARLKLHEPPLSLRVYKGTPPELWEAAIETAKLVGGVPTLQNDEIIIPALMAKGMALEDARNYCIIGCMEPAASGNEWPACGGTGGSTMINLVKMLIVALNDGRAPGSDVQSGLHTGYLKDMTSFDQVLEAYKKTVEYFIGWHISCTNIFEMVASEYMPYPVVSATMGGCMEKGADVMWGGAEYNSTGSAGVGCANIGDALSAIKYFVFDKKLVSAEEYYNAYMNNWEGYEVLRSKVFNLAPRYGNDDPYVDELASWAMDVFSDALNAGVGPRGTYRAGLYPVSAHVRMGLGTHASPDGRKTGDPLADGISPMQACDTNGPSAVLNSVARINHFNNANGTQLNMRFHPNAVLGESGTIKLKNLIETFFDKGGMHIQYNVVSSDTLREAQVSPDEHRDLVIRVAGYSAYFVELGKALQDDLIHRTEQSF